MYALPKYSESRVYFPHVTGPLLTESQCCPVVLENRSQDSANTSDHKESLLKTLERVTRFENILLFHMLQFKEIHLLGIDFPLTFNILKFSLCCCIVAVNR